MKFNKFQIIILFYFFVFGKISFSQNPQWIIYTPQNSGLPSHNVYWIAIDTSNVKWISTYNGFVKFDGLSWTVYDTNNSAIPMNNVGKFVIDRNNDIWITTSGKGLVKFNRTKWVIYNTSNSGLPTNTLLSIAIDSNNNKWIGTQQKGLVKYNDISWTIYDTSNSGLQENSVMRIAIENNIKWIGTSGSGLAKFNDTNWVIYKTTNSGLQSNFIRSLFIDVDGDKWIGTAVLGVSKFNSNNNSWVLFNNIWPGIPTTSYNSILVDNRNIKWFGNLNCLVKYNDTNVVLYGNPMPEYTAVYDIKLDKYNNLWIATTSGLYVHNPYGIVGINKSIEYLSSSSELNQNYPNPYNMKTNISFYTSIKGNVTIKIFNISGKEEMTILNEEKNIGKYNISYNAEMISSGIYFYSLYINGILIKSKKMIVIK